MASKCGDVVKEIVKNDNRIKKEMGKKCEDRNKDKARIYEYFGKKFGFSRVLWVIKNYCITLPLKGKVFCVSEFYVRGLYLTRWEMSLERSYKVNEYKIFFRLKRLPCEPFHKKVVADCFVEYSDHYEGKSDIEFNKIFEVNMDVKEEAKSAGITPTAGRHSHECELKLEILVYFEDLQENIPLCENLGIRRLSEDLRDLYHNGVLSDLSVLLASNRKLEVHKAILTKRITNENFKTLITSDATEIDLEEFIAENVEKVIKFLYTGNLNYTVLPDPSIAVFKFAEYLDVKPIISYYNPDEITFISDTDAEEFSVTWTIEGFCNRNDYFLLSPVMTNKMMDMKWQMQIYPKGIRNEDVYLDICLVYKIIASKDICVEIFLQGRPQGRFSYRCHQHIDSDGKLKVRNIFKLNEVKRNYIQDDNLIVGLELRMSNGQDNPPVCSETKANCKYLSEQKYYVSLSDDILSLRDIEKFNLQIYLDHHNIILNIHECVLLARSQYFFDSLKNHLYRFNDTAAGAIFDVTYFVYSGKLDKRRELSKVFELYPVAEKFNYEHLKRIIEEHLLKILSRSNAPEIERFARNQRIQNLEDFARNFHYL